MTSQYVQMFHIPLVHMEVKDWKTKKEKLKDLIDYKSFRKGKLDEPDTDFFYRKNFFQSDQFDEISKESGKIKEIFWEEFKEFVLGLGLTEYDITGFWFETSVKGQHHEIHNHGTTGYSVVCFIEFDENYHRPTNFTAPFNNFLDGTVLIHEPPDIKEGSLIFFPSAIHHFAPPNYSDVPRMILSFNLKVR